jgi:hypothetical protein
LVDEKKREKDFNPIINKIGSEGYLGNLVIRLDQAMTVCG